MQETSSIVTEANIHTRVQSLIFRAKAAVFQAKRAVENVAGGQLQSFPKTDNLASAEKIADSKTPLWTETARQEQFLLAGKAQNLRIAAACLDGIEVPAGKVFSFWKHVGRTSTLKGYVVGRELREGCIVPNVGGGLCQLSNALYDAALQANFEIVERHAHTQVIAGSLAERGRDATVFWNYVDLRFRSDQPFRIEAKLGRDHLRVVFRGVKTSSVNFVQIGARGVKPEKQPNSCATCGVESCFRSVPLDANIDFGRTAYLVDEFVSEFDNYLQSERASKDLLFSPLDGRRFGKSNYAWRTDGFHKSSFSTIRTLIRSYKSRRLVTQGAARQRALLDTADALAASYAKKLPFDATHLVVSQNLLPYLWKNGHLGGRTFDVLMTQLPAREIQRRLDFAYSLHPESPTLGDFRLSEVDLEIENDALINARKIITPHAAIAKLFGDRGVLLDWTTPTSATRASSANARFTVVFPASTVGRKGCYELREALRDFDVALVTLGPQIEGDDFWSGFDQRRGDETSIAAADLVVLPAFVEHRPRRLLTALAAGIPVIASESCGVSGAIVVPDGDASALRSAIEAVIADSRR